MNGLIEILTNLKITTKNEKTDYFSPILSTKPSKAVQPQLC